MDETPIPPQFLQPDPDAPPISEEEWDEIMRTAEAEAADFGVSVEEVFDLGVQTASRWKIESEADAQWAMAQLAALNAEMEAVTDQSAAWLAQIVKWVEDVTRQSKRRALFFEGQLIRWGHEQRAANPKKATFKLVAGDVATTNRKATIEIEDQEAVIAWLKTHYNGQLVRKKEDVLVSDLRGITQIRDRVMYSTVELACGHQANVEGKSTIGEMVSCPEGCGLADGAPTDGDALIPVVEVCTESFEQIVLPMLPLGSNAEQPIPGTRVNPAKTSVKVKPHI